MAADKRVTVVYIEDEKENLALVSRLLEATGRYRVLGAANGEDGLALVDRERPALVLTDLDIPGINGFEVTRRVKGHVDPDIARIPVVAVTANVLVNERRAALEAGCSGFLAKPFTIQEFRREIERILDESWPGRPRNP